MLFELRGVDEVGGPSVVLSGEHRRGRLRGLDDRRWVQEKIVGPKGSLVAGVCGVQVEAQRIRDLILDAGQAGSGGGDEVGGGDDVEYELGGGTDGRDVAEALDAGEEHGGRRDEGDRREDADGGGEQQAPVAANALQDELEW